MAKAKHTVVFCIFDISAINGGVIIPGTLKKVFAQKHYLCP
jgi:hypothetical protein